VIESFGASGDLSGLDFPKLLIYLNEIQFEGQALFNMDQLTKTILMKRGIIAYGVSNDFEDALDRVLVKYNFISEAQLKEATDASMQTHKSLAKYLIENQIVTSEDLLQASSLQVREIAGSLIVATGFSYFLKKDAIPSNAPNLQINPFQIIFDSVFTSTDMEWIHKQLGSSNRIFGQTEDFVKRYKEIVYTEETDLIITKIDGKTSIEDLIKIIAEDADKVKKTLAALYVLGMLKIISDSPLDKPSPSISPVPAASTQRLDPEEMKRRAKLEFPDKENLRDLEALNTTSETTKKTESEGEDFSFAEILDEVTSDIEKPASTQDQVSPDPPPPELSGELEPDLEIDSADIDLSAIEEGFSETTPGLPGSDAHDSIQIPDVDSITPAVPQPETTSDLASSEMNKLAQFPTPSDAPQAPSPASVELPLQPEASPMETASAPPSPDCAPAAPPSTDLPWPSQPDSPVLPPIPSSESKPLDFEIKREADPIISPPFGDDSSDLSSDINIYGSEPDKYLEMLSRQRKRRTRIRGFTLILVLLLAAAALLYFNFYDKSGSNLFSFLKIGKSSNEQRPESVKVPIKNNSRKPLPQQIIRKQPEKKPVRNALANLKPITLDLMSRKKYHEAAKTWKTGLKKIKGYTWNLETVCMSSSVTSSYKSDKQLDNFFLLPRMSNGRSCFIICWGIYNSSSEASKKYKNLPSYVKTPGHTPKVKIISELL